MQITLLSIGKITSKWILEGINEYEKRLENYIKFETIIIPDIKNAKNLTKDKIKIAEGKEIIRQLNSSDLVVISDEKGKEFTSVEFSSWIEKQIGTGKKRIVFIIGGPYGFSNEVYERGNYKIALSKMTLTHEMAKLILTEQLYRAFTILKGEPYHHE